MRIRISGFGFRISGFRPPGVSDSGVQNSECPRFEVSDFEFRGVDRLRELCLLSLLLLSDILRLVLQRLHLISGGGGQSWGFGFQGSVFGPAFQTSGLGLRLQGPCSVSKV